MSIFTHPPAGPRTPPPKPGPATNPPKNPPPRPKPGKGRTARVLTQLGRYVLAWGLVGWACYWLVDIHLFVPGLVLAAMVGNPWRPKKSRIPEGASFARRRGAGAISGLALRGALAGPPSGPLPPT